MLHSDLTNAEWERLMPLLPDGEVRQGRRGDHRTVINGVLYQARTGAPWRSLPDRFGCWITVYKRQRRWAADGTWQRLFSEVQAAQDGDGQVGGGVSVTAGVVRIFDVGLSSQVAYDEGAGLAQQRDPVLASLALRLAEVIQMGRRKG
ncbi:hypothetical protein DMB42_12385 [Nonomuraea sp. WAC 01424]|uniref:transposase n=1 Tax=Nonomuraea sp. WAC 01424 TaxID=2203200 RepID=UPI000F765DA4|nr:hypothetical protein DMB42_12385 [Nonomuraea sp. WAC 01424]